MRRTVSLSFTVLLALTIAFSVALYTISEAQAAPYSQVVDNATAGRFSASSKWIGSSWNAQRYGPNYRVLKRPLSVLDTAKWKVKIPARGLYNVYARWPDDPGYTGRAAYRISTVGGAKLKVVSQRTNGARWVKLGTYSMAAGDGWKVQLSSRSSSSGYIVADAVMVVKSTGGTTVADSGGVTGADIVRKASQYLGYPYTYGGESPSTGFDCSGLTQYVYGTFGKTLPRTASDQYYSGPGTRVSSPVPGDLIFGHAKGGSGIQHVGIYAGKDSSGRRLMIHAGTPQTDVERTTYESWYTVIGYKRILSN